MRGLEAHSQSPFTWRAPALSQSHPPSLPRSHTSEIWTNNETRRRVPALAAHLVLAEVDTDINDAAPIDPSGERMPASGSWERPFASLSNVQRAAVTARLYRIDVHEGRR